MLSKCEEEENGGDDDEDAGARGGGGKYIYLDAFGILGKL